MSAYLRLLRPKQWTKNLLVFAALLFTRGWERPEAIQQTLIAFLAMCAAASATYILNDLLDIRRDRQHPVKKHRPLASGAAKPIPALILAAVLALASLGGAVWLGSGALGIIGAYLAVQAGYTFRLKRVPILDVFLVASGFVLRAALGAAAISVTISPWLLSCTAALALLLGFGKRRHEYVLQGDERAKSRESLGGYTKEALDALVVVMAAVAAMSYAIYAIDSPTAVAFPGLVLTTPFVLYGISRYVFVLFALGDGGEPENILLFDPHVLGSVLGFVLAAVAALSGMRLPVLE